jgi:hypothetical protein
MQADDRTALNRKSGVQMYSGEDSNSKDLLEQVGIGKSRPSQEVFFCRAQGSTRASAQAQPSATCCPRPAANAWV